MRSHRNRLEDQLRAARPQPRRDFVDGLAHRVAADTPSPLFGRVLRAAAVTAVGAALFGATGGLGYASSAASSVAHAAKPVEGLVRAVVASPKAPPHAAPARFAAQHEDEDDRSPSHDQYKPGKGCGDKNHVHAREDECKQGR
jgi:hypothetical protein